MIEKEPVQKPAVSVFLMIYFLAYLSLILKFNCILLKLFWGKKYLMIKRKRNCQKGAHFLYREGGRAWE